MPGRTPEEQTQYMREYRAKKAQEKKEKMAAEFSATRAVTPSPVKRKRGVETQENPAHPAHSRDWTDLIQSMTQRQRDDLLLGMVTGKRGM